MGYNVTFFVRWIRLVNKRTVGLALSEIVTYVMAVGSEWQESSQPLNL